MDLRKRKAYRLHYVVHGQDLVLGEHSDLFFNLPAMRRVPPQKCKSIYHGLWEEPLILICLYGNISESLRKFLPFVVE